ncbi:kita-kyushu lung cancer antigen 1 [Nycticebus coucang]|uniref:kita-kyushu lung cancer antigen 1 n=1 Tax=Nycticebus coucang TaxID=9470 RepID=UPI00234D9FA3|nr:kita-kyushu lung cancer antigen 1 [Nycticebus coucang]
MGIFWVLASCMMFTFMIVVWKIRFRRNTISPNSTSLAVISNSSTGSPKISIDGSFSVNDLSRDILNNFPHSIAMQKRILVNLRIVEYKLAELEHFLVTKGLNGALVNRKSTEKLTKCKDSRENQ